MKSRIFCAIDTEDLEQALLWIKQLKGEVQGIKLGLAFFNAHGQDGVKKVMSIAGPNAKLFLDLKFHDIPNTVRGAVRAIKSVRPDFLTIHTAGGIEMMQAARAEADPKTKILGVTVLTHIKGDQTEIADQVKIRADQAKQAGLNGVVCSALEVETLRQIYTPDDFTLVVPGIRPTGSAKNDQTRIMTPAEAIGAGADYLVIGRPITQSENLAQTAREIVTEMEQATRQAA